ncbi:Fe-S metabolism associated SufE, partial [mine drainage metagenome]
ETAGPAAELKTEEHRVQGCQSLVWIQGHGDATRLDFEAVSDSAIVSGLIALLLRVYSGRCAREIMDTEPEFIRAIGLAKALSSTRANGLAAMLRKSASRPRRNCNRIDRAPRAPASPCPR